MTVKIPNQIQKWLDTGVFPQRVILSGSGDNVLVALTIASALQSAPIDRIAKGIHADTLFFQDTGKSFKIRYSDTAKKDDQREVENVEGLVHWSHQKPASAYRIAILENFERMSREAPHALLKLVEEPPVRTIFLFTTRNHHKILDTILSRMTVVRLPHIVSKDVPKEDLAEEAEHFFQSQDLLERFQIIESLDKKIKDKKERVLAQKFVEKLLDLERFGRSSGEVLELLWQTHQALAANANVRFTLERMALGF